jgi:hypothetical protein
VSLALVWLFYAVVVVVLAGWELRRVRRNRGPHGRRLNHREALQLARIALFYADDNAPEPGYGPERRGEGA